MGRKLTKRYAYYAEARRVRTLNRLMSAASNGVILKSVHSELWAVFTPSLDGNEIRITLFDRKGFLSHRDDTLSGVAKELMSSGFRNCVIGVTISEEHERELVNATADMYIGVMAIRAKCRKLEESIKSKTGKEE